MKAITVRNIDEELERAMKEKRLKTGKSINTIILEALKSSFFSGRSGKNTYNDLDHLAGTWTAQDEREFIRNTARFNEPDEDIWIASTAMEHGLMLVSYDAHFE